LQRHHRQRHRWLWIFISLGAIAALIVGLRVRPEYPPNEAEPAAVGER
jgi:hypothetical protein